VGPNVNDDDTDDQVFLQSPDIQLIKTGELIDVSPAGHNPGDYINYKFKVKNTGNVTLSSITLSDPQAVISGGPIITLIPGEEDSITFTGVHTLTQADIDAGSFNNIATVSGLAPDNSTTEDSDDDTQIFIQSPSLIITKDQVGGPSPVNAAGQIIDYAIIVKNTGNITLHNIGINDQLPNGNAGILSGPVEDLTTDGNLEVGETWTYTISYTVTQNDIDLGDPLVNTATVTTDELPTPETDDATTPVDQLPSMSVVKTQVGGPNPVTTAGQIIDYTIVIENTGNLTLTGIVPVDMLPNGMVGTLAGPTESISSNGQLDVAETWTYTISYTVTQSDIDAGIPLVNHASVTTNELPDPETDDETTPVSQAPLFTVVKTQTSLPDTITVAGQVISYQIVVTNTGNVSLNNVIPVDVMPDGSIGLLSGPSESLSNDGVLQTGEVWTYTTSYTVTQSDINNGADLINSVSVDTDETPDPVTDEENTPIKQLPAIQLLKTGTYVDLAPVGYNAGDEIHYTFEVQNTGNVTLYNVYITDYLVNVLGGPIPIMNPGDVDNTTISAIYTIQQSDINNGSFSNQAFAYGTPPSGPEVSDDDTDDQTFIQTPSIQLVKKGLFVDLAPAGYNVGDQIEYKFYVTNTGNVTLNNIEITDPLVVVNGGTLSSLSPGETDSITYSAVYTITQLALDTAAVTNTASVVGYAPDNSPVEDSDTYTEVLVQQPMFTVTKTQTGGPNPVAIAGSIIDYTIDVVNTGNITLTNINVVDIMPDGSNAPVGTATESMTANGLLEVGETWSYNISYTVTQADIDNGTPLVNHVSVTTDETPDPVTDEETTPIGQLPAFTVTKTQVSGANPVTTAGQIIGYQIVVANTGNVSLNNIVITDVMPDGSTGVLSAPSESALNNGVLEVGESWTYTTNYTVSQSDIDNGSPLVNHVSVTTDETPDPETDEETTPVQQNPAFTVNKTQTSGPNPVTAAGDVIGYTIAVVNTGNVSLNNIVITDVMPDGSTGVLGLPNESLVTDGVLNVAETWIYSINYIVTQSDVDAGLSLVNHVTVTTEEDPDPKMDEESTPVSQQPSLWSDKSSSFDLGVNAISNPGDIITYTYHVTNNGKVTLSNVSINESSGQFTGGGVLPVPVYQSSSMGSPQGTLLVGETATYVASYAITFADIIQGKVENRALAQGDSPLGVTVMDDSDSGNIAEPNETNTPSDPAGSDPTTTLIPPPPPVAVNDVDLDNMPGTAVVVDILNNDHLYNGSTPLPSTVTVTLIDPATGMPTLTPYTVTIPGQGSYVYNPTTGEITFTPVPGYTSDPDNIDYILTENATGLSDTANVLITYLEASPFANDDSSLGNAVGTNATVNLLANDQLSDGSQATTTNTSVILIDPATGMPTVTPNVVTIPGQGVYTYNPATGDLTFDPFDGFTTDPTPISYILTETLTGLTDPALVTITYIEQPPVANDDSSLGNTVGTNATVNLLTNDQLSDGSQATTTNTSVVLIDPTTSMPTVTPNVVTIPGQGVYTFNPATGDLTFDPFDGFTTDPTPISYILTETLTGLTDDAVVTITYIEEPPVANDDSSSGNTVGMNAIVNLLTNDQLSDGTQATTSNTSVVLIDPATGIPTVTPNVVTIPGQGVYTFNPATGDLTFDPFDGFTTDPTPISYILTEILTGLTDNAVVTITYIEQPPVAIDDSSLGNTVGTNVTLNLLTNDQLSDGSQATTTNTSVVLIDPATGMPTITPNVVTVAGQGVYTYNPATGDLTFDPDNGFTSDPTPIPYVLMETLTGLTDPAIVTIDYYQVPPIANDDSSLGNTVGSNATVNLLVNDQLADGSQATTTNTSVELIDPATGMPTVTPNVVTISGQGVYTYNPSTGDLTFDPFDGFTTDPTPISYILTETLTGLTDDAVVTMTYIEEPPVANDDNSLGNTVGTNATVNLLTNDQLSDGSQATTTNTSIVLIDPATGMPTVTPNVVAIPGQGVYTYNPATGDLTFDPFDGFTTDPSPIDYTLTENQTGLSDNATVTITYIEMPPFAVDDFSNGNVPGTNAIVNILSNDDVSDGSPATTSNTTVVLIDPVTGMPTVTPNQVTIPGQGTYTYNPATGDLTFDPVDGFTTDPDPIDYILTEVMTGLTDQATVTITYDEVPPIANDDTSSGNTIGNNVDLNILTNDQLSDGSPATVANTGVVLIDPSTGMPTLTPNVINIPGVGIYTYNPATGVLTFDPAPGFTSDPTPINYILTEIQTGLTDEALVTINYDEMPPIANDDNSFGNVVGTNASLNILANDMLSDGSQATPINATIELIDPATGFATLTPNVVTIAGQGVYTYNPATGVLTFDPNPGFTTDPTPINYILTETLTGLSDQALVTITYNEIPPVANDDQSTGNVPGNNATLNLLTNDAVADGTQATVGNTSVTLIDPATGLPTATPNVVTIAGQGVYTYNPATGVLTFDPNPGFTTDPAPINYILTETLTGLSDQANVAITYNEIPPVANDDQSLGNVPGNNATVNLLTNDDLSDGSQATLSNTTVTLIDPATGLATLTPNVVTIAGQGVYTYNPANGVLTFDPNPGFTTDPTSISYLLTEVLTGLTDPAVVTMTYAEQPPVANDDSSLGNAVGTNATVNLLTNDQLSDGSQATTTNTTVTLIDPATGLATATPNVVTIPGQGVYTYNPATGVLTFDPNVGFTTDPTPISYTLTEVLTGLKDNAKVTVTYNEIPPVANDDSSLDNSTGVAVSLNILANDDLSDGSQATTANTSVVLINPATGLPTVTPNTVTIPGQGVYTYNPATGVLTFTPNVGYTGDPTPLPYRLTETQTGLSDMATATITYLDFVQSIGSLVWEDLNGDGIYQTNEPGVPNVQVQLFDPSGNLIATTFTDNTGHFVFNNILAGTYYFTFTPDPSYGFTFPNVGSNNNVDSDVDGAFGPGTTGLITFNAGQVDLSWNAGLYKCVEIGEKVWYDVDKDDILDQSENGINGLKVNLWRVVGSTKSIYESKYTGHKPGTGSTDGYFKFCAPPGTYYIEVVMPPIGLVQARANIGNDDNIDSDLTNANGKSTTSNFTVLSGQSKTDIGAGFYPMATAGNLVWIDDNSDGLQQAEEPRVANVLVEAFDSQNQKVGEDYTDQNGVYKIEYLGKSSYYLKFNPPAGYGYTAPNLQDDAINSDVDHSNGLNTTRTFAMSPGVNYVNIDAGLAFGALPVRWLEVKAENKGDHNVIFWSTASEVNTDKFIVQRRHESEDEFTNIAEVKAAGLATNVSTYNATDADVEKGGVYYYRIQQWDLDGHNTLSKTVAVRLEVKHNVIGLYPNPARDYSTLSLDLKGEEDAMISIFDAEGRLVQIHHLKSESRFGLSRKLRISGLATGVYMVQTTQGSYTDTRKLIMTE
ncbi:MAG TPA: SdrD B-like domain-containing protein, partial [Saprospiraceae bacterium]|nr:SdrD B-like domain-containing protein [Saprospiraceae bacterium]